MQALNLVSATRELRHRLPLTSDKHEERDKLGHGGADIADAENAERGTLLLHRIPARNIGEADGERAAGDATLQRRHGRLRVGVLIGQQERRDRRGEHIDGEDEPAGVLVGRDSEYDADQRASQDRRARERSELRLVESEIRAKAHADDNREERPHRETDGEGDRAHRKGHRLIGAID